MCGWPLDGRLAARSAKQAALVCSLVLASQPVAATGPLAVKIDHGLGPGNIFQLQQEVRKSIVEGDLREELLHYRQFGLGGTGHETLFLHKHLDNAMPNLRQRLLDLAVRADEIAGWNATTETALSARCLELIRYQGSDPAQEQNASNLSSLGWHGDGATLITLTVMLSKAEDYEGGAVEFRAGPSQERYELESGDVLAWRGGTQHRVVPVTKGLRDVFVVEWWLGEDCTTSFDPRGADSVEGLRNALVKDPGSANLHRLLGEALCAQLPCADRQTAISAEAEFRKAVALAPQDATIVHSLGTFLLGSSGFPRGTLRRAEGLRHLREAHELDASVAGPVPPELGELDVIVDQVWRFTLVAVALMVVASLIKILERMESSLKTARPKKPESSTKKEWKKDT